MSVRHKLFSILAGGAVLGALLVTGGTNAMAAEKSTTCSGGTVAPGTYENLTIRGFCTLDGGNVTVERNVRITSTGGLEALFANSRLTVGRDVLVEHGGLLALGCDPVELACMDDPNATTHDRIARSLIADAPTLMILHDNRIGSDVRQKGGGGGFSCNPLFPNGPPAYSDYANNRIGGSATVTGLQTCWSGFSHNVVGESVTYSHNQTSIPDGNLIDGNRIGEDLSCFANSPSPHLSDAGPPTKNVVGDDARGQCAAISVSRD